MPFERYVCLCMACSIYAQRMELTNKPKQTMKLEKIGNNINSFEKNAFLKMIDTLIAANPKNAKAIESMSLRGGTTKQPVPAIQQVQSKDLKNTDSLNIVNVFKLLEDEFTDYVKCEFLKTTSQLDILINLDNNDLIIVKCKTIWESNNNKFSTVSRHLKMMIP